MWGLDRHVHEVHMEEPDGLPLILCCHQLLGCKGRCHGVAVVIVTLCAVPLLQLRTHFLGCTGHMSPLHSHRGLVAAGCTVQGEHTVLTGSVRLDGSVPD